MITSNTKDFKGRITLLFILPCHDSLASSFYTDRIERWQHILPYHARKKDVQCLEKLIPALLENGYKCVTVSEALARSYHWTITASGNTALNLLGLSEQVASSWEYLSDGPYKTYELAAMVAESVSPRESR